MLREFVFQLLVSGSQCSHTSSWLAENRGGGKDISLMQTNNQGWDGGRKKRSASLEAIFGGSTGVKCMSSYIRLAKMQ